MKGKRVGIFLGIVVLIIIASLYFFFGDWDYVNPSNVEISNLKVSASTITFDANVKDDESFFKCVGGEWDSRSDENGKEYLSCNLLRKFSLKKDTDSEAGSGFTIPREVLEEVNITEIYYGFGENRILVWESSQDDKWK